MGDGQRSEDTIPFSSDTGLLGRPAEGGAELAAPIVGDGADEVKRREWWPG
jgi:hypothetical protein